MKKFKIFGWQISRVDDKPKYDDADRLACFVLMAFTDKVAAMLRHKGIKAQISDSDREAYLEHGRVSARVAQVAARLRRDFLPQIHLLLRPDIKPARILNFHQMPTLDADFMDRVAQCTGGWARTPQGIPFHSLFDYHPLNGGQGVTDADVLNRQLVWNFKYAKNKVTPRKHVNALYDAVIPLAAFLKDTFGDLGEQLTLFCIPASNIDSQWLRYREFSRMLCTRTGMYDSFHHVTIGSEKAPKHLGGEAVVNYHLDAKWFYGKAVVVFDDILTTGESLHTCTQMLHEVGAKVVAACFLGHTVKKMHDS